MRFKIILFVFLITYIFSGVFLDYFTSTNSISFKDIQEQIILNENEFYWKDLIGKEVELENGTFVGVVTEIIETGSDDVLVVEKENQKELIPFNFGEVIKKVSGDLIIVDWHI